MHKENGVNKIVVAFIDMIIKKRKKDKGKYKSKAIVHVVNESNRMYETNLSTTPLRDIEIN
jgi:hypothetical protein